MVVYHHLAGDGFLPQAEDMCVKLTIGVNNCLSSPPPKTTEDIYISAKLCFEIRARGNYNIWYFKNGKLK